MPSRAADSGARAGGLRVPRSGRSGAGMRLAAGRRSSAGGGSHHRCRCSIDAMADARKGDGGGELRLSVIVPATDGPPTLDLCLTALMPTLGDADEVVVVDEPAGGGPAAARNAGARRALGDVLVFIDSDVVVHGDALHRVARRSPKTRTWRRSSARTTTHRRHLASSRASATSSTITCTSRPRGLRARSGPGWERFAERPSPPSEASTRPAPRSRTSSSGCACARAASPSSWIRFSRPPI